MLIVIFTYSGISAVAMAASDVEKPYVTIPKATVILASGTSLLYVVSIFIVVTTVDWRTINTNISPFVQGLDNMGYGWASTLINSVILISAFSVMLASYYSCVQMLVSLTHSNEAPEILGRCTKKGLYKYSWFVTGIISILVVLMSFVLGTKLFNYLISSSSYFSFLNWTINLITYILWLKNRGKDEIHDSPLIKGKTAAVITIIIIAVLFVMSLQVRDFRIGFYTAFIILLIISIMYKRRSNCDL